MGSLVVSKRSWDFLRSDMGRRDLTDSSGSFVIAVECGNEGIMVNNSHLVRALFTFVFFRGQSTF